MDLTQTTSSQAYAGAVSQLSHAASALQNARKHLKLIGVDEDTMRQLHRLEGEAVGLLLRFQEEPEPMKAAPVAEITKPKTFEVGRSYSTRSACDYDCVYTWTVLKRTAKQMTLVESGAPFQYLRRGVYADSDGVEHCRPNGVYSMSPCISADRPDKAVLSEQTALADLSRYAK